MTQTVDIKKEAGTLEGKEAEEGIGRCWLSLSLSPSLSLGSASKPVLGTKNGLSAGKGAKHTHTHTHNCHLPAKPMLYVMMLL